MRKKRIIYLAITLTAVLIMPLGFKFAHSFSHEHDIKHINSNEIFLDTFEDHCSICDFEYANFISGYSYIANYKQIFYQELFPELPLTYLNEYKGINEPLRGPPSTI